MYLPSLALRFQPFIPTGHNLLSTREMQLRKNLFDSFSPRQIIDLLAAENDDILLNIIK